MENKPILSPYVQPANFVPPVLPHVQIEIRGTFESPVTLELVFKTIIAWVTRRNLVHQNVLLTHK